MTASGYFKTQHSLQSLSDATTLEVISQDPPRVRVTIHVDGETMALTYDETVSVVAVDGEEGG